MITSGFPLLIVIAAIVVLAVTGNLLTWSPLVIAVQVAAPRSFGRVRIDSFAIPCTRPRSSSSGPGS